MNASMTIRKRKTTQDRPWVKARRLCALSLALMCLLALWGAPVAQAAQPASVTLTLQQHFTASGSSTPAKDIFTYQLTPNSASNPMPAGSALRGFTLAVEGNADASIGPFIFDEPGIYSYELSCITASDANLRCDQAIYTITIYVKGDLSAYVIVSTQDGTKTPAVEFDQSYQVLPSDPTVMVDPPVVKTISGDVPAKDGTFTFRLSAEDPSSPMPAESNDGVKIIRITGAGQADFGDWTYTHDGTYRYTVFEVNDALPGYIYDTTIYTIIDRVQDVDGQLVVNRTVVNGEGKQLTSLPLTLPFNNRYASPDKGIFGGGKTSGGLPKTGDIISLASILAPILIGVGLMIILPYLRRRRQEESSH